jgi:hypothetical protein
MTVWLKNTIEGLGLVGAVVMPLFNIPLIVRLLKRKRSDDLSLTWAMGVWACIILMTPQVIVSENLTFKAFGIVNLFSFSIVAFLVLKYRNNQN